MLETDLPFVSLWCAVGGEYVERDGDWQMTASDTPRSVIIASEPLTTDPGPGSRRRSTRC